MGMWEWLKKRLESILDNLIFAGVVALGLAIWNVIKELSLPWIIGISIGVFLIIIGLLRLVVFFINKSTKEKAKAEVRVEKVTKSECLIDTLADMHRRLVEIKGEKASRMDIQAKQLEEVFPILADRMGTVKLKDWPKFKLNINSRIRRVIPRKTRRLWGNFFESMKWRERARVAVLSEALKIKDELFRSKEWKFEDGLKISEWLDGYDWGVKKLRDNDQKWNALFNSISHYLKDKVLRKLIDKHIDLSYMYNDVSLIIHYSGKWKNNEFSLMLHEALIGSPISPEKAEIALSEILSKIENHIQGQLRSENLNSNLSITCSPMDEYIRVHTCSQCGWGFKVLSTMLGNRTITCPKCGNVEVNDNI